MLAFITIFIIHGVFTVFQALWSVKERQRQNRVYYSLTGMSIETKDGATRGTEGRRKNTPKQWRRSGLGQPESCPSGLASCLCPFIFVIDVCTLPDQPLNIHNHWSSQLYLGGSLWLWKWPQDSLFCSFKFHSTHIEGTHSKCLVVHFLLRS